jgi:hypothetical protein
MDTKTKKSIDRAAVAFNAKFEACADTASKVKFVQDYGKSCKRDPKKYAVLRMFTEYKLAMEPQNSLYRSMDFAITIMFYALHFTPSQSVDCINMYDEYKEAVKAEIEA